MSKAELRSLERLCRRFPISQTHIEIVAYLKQLKQAIDVYLSEIWEV
jgi:hypothetical protein